MEQLVNMAKKKPASPIETILKNKRINLLVLFEILKGIDKTHQETKEGWWELEKEAMFGNEILKQILKQSEFY